MEEAEHPDPVIKTYKDFRIEAYKIEPGALWRVRITRIDGANIKTSMGEFPKLCPADERLTAEAIIDFAKEKIDAGGMSAGDPASPKV